ncbi:MAG: FG-GAP repeat domain-containing protein [Christensenellales bacterium]|jgi:hypothetical protein
MFIIGKLLKLIVKLLAFLLSLAILLLLVLYGYNFTQNIFSPYETADEPPVEGLGNEWSMHNLANTGDWFPASLSAADVNGDGHLDYLICYAMAGKVRISIHPGANNAASISQWASIDIATLKNPQSATFADLDNDGVPEIVVATGVEYQTADALSALHVLRQKGDVWEQAGIIQSSEDKGQYESVQAVDINGDGYLDLVVGGRSNRSSFHKDKGSALADLSYSGLKWFENPGGKYVFSMEKWPMHIIDTQAHSGLQIVCADVNSDGLVDVLLSNTGPDAPKDKLSLLLYQNQGGNFSRSALFLDDTLPENAPITVADLDGSGSLDILLHTDKEILVFSSGVSSPKARIAKPEAAQHAPSLLAAVDVNGDGRMDIIGGLTHQNGSLPKEKTALFWLENHGGSYTPHVVKWGDNFLGVGPLQFNGEKWLYAQLHDVDGDGDVDIVALCREYNLITPILSVVWLENPAIP